MSDAPASFKSAGGQRQVRQSRDSTTAKRKSLAEKDDGGTSVYSRAGALTFAHSQSGDAAGILRGVLGRRLSNTTSTNYGDPR